MEDQIAFQAVSPNARIISSVADDAWAESHEPGSFQSWRFAAVSDDGMESVIISFYDNYPFSPRYVDALKKSDEESARTCPAVSFVYSVEGKAVMRSLNEYSASELCNASPGPGLSIGRSSFKFDEASYGAGFVVEIDVVTARQRRIVGRFEWLSVEADLDTNGVRGPECDQTLNLVAARSDVSGRITMIGRNKLQKQLVHFRGTGSHEKFCCRGPFTAPIKSEYLGSAHYADMTAFFFNAVGEADAAKLIIIRDGILESFDALPDRQNFTRDVFGLRVPRRLSFATSDNLRLRVKPLRLIQSGFCEVNMLSEMTLMMRDGKPRKTIGITQFIEPRHAKRRMVQFLSDLRMGRNGKPPLF